MEGPMTTTHSFNAGADARLRTSYDAAGLGPESVHLVVTSPPYPMIAMWDEAFIGMNREIESCLGEEGDSESGARPDGRTAFELMHRELDRVWRELFRILVPGGIACINIGDATRSLGGVFRLFPNHARIISACMDAGFDMLPEVLWRKPNNSPTKFMGSGMLPPRAYVTYEHEYILIFRKPGERKLTSKTERSRRNRSAYFWEERNAWFTDLWEFIGTRQETARSQKSAAGQGDAARAVAAARTAGSDSAAEEGQGSLFSDLEESPSPSLSDLRSRSAAFPFELPYRLINMYSLQEDTVLDPFGGTGTTMQAAMVSGRSSVLLEYEAAFADVAAYGMRDIVGLGGRMVRERRTRHREFLAEYEKRGKTPKYINEFYGFPVITRQERALQFPVSAEIRELPGSGGADSVSRWEVRYGFNT
jgi:modification methylase